MDPSVYPRPHRKSQKSPETDLTTHIKAKLQEYGQAITSLEQYKALCEARIQDLAPGHPLPVLQEHLGKKWKPTFRDDFGTAGEKTPGTFQSSEQRSIVRNQVSILETEKEELEQMKKELETNLRAEVLHSEEQRAYIEALKQAIESKMSSLGIIGLNVEEFCQVAKSHGELQDNQIATARMQGALISQEEMIHQLQAKLTQQSADFEELKTECTHYQKEFSESDEALQHAISEMNKLEEEKSSLLDYIEAHKQQETQLQDLLDTIEPELLTIKQEHEDMTSKHQELLSQQENYETTIETLESTNKKLLEKVNKLETEVKDLTKELGIGSQKDKDQESELAAALGKIRTLTANQATLSESLQETQGEMDAIQAANAELLKELTKTQETQERNAKLLHENETEKSALWEEREKLTKAKEELEANLVETRNRLEATTGKVSELVSIMEGKEAEMSILSSKLADLQPLEPLLQETRAQLSQLQDSNQASEHANDDLTQKLGKLTQEHEELLAELHSLTLSSTASNRVYGQLQDELQGLKLELTKEQHENQELQGYKERVVRKMEDLVEENKALIGELTNIRQSDHTSKLELQRLRLEAEEVRGALLRLTSELSLSSEYSEEILSWKDWDQSQILETLRKVQIAVSGIVESSRKTDAEVGRIRKEIEKTIDLLESRESELVIAHKEIDSLRARLDFQLSQEEEISTLQQRLAVTNAECENYRALFEENTEKMAETECRISCLLRENEDLQNVIGTVYKSITSDRAKSVLEKMIRCMSDLQTLYKAQFDSECQRLSSPDSIPVHVLQSIESRISAAKRLFGTFDEELKTGFFLDKHRARELENVGMVRRTQDSPFRSPGTLIDRLNLPKTRTEGLKNRAGTDL